MSAPLTAEELWQLIPEGSAPIAKGCGRYRVTLVEWLSHDVLIDAPSQGDAEEIAEQVWSEIGDDAFRLRDSGTDSIWADLIEEGVQ